MKLKLIHLFPELMNIYGDQGNIITLTKRAAWRGIEMQVISVNHPGDFDLMSEGDIFFFGGGQDHDQMRVWETIAPEKEHFVDLIRERVDALVPFLLICGGYQLFGQYFLDAHGRRIPGLGILDITTVAPGPEVKSRCIGNILIQTHLPIEPQTLVGFENHGGQTQLGTGMQHLGRVIKGYGDNVKDGVEGCIYKHIYGCYMHGSLLPKNPHFADFLLTQAITSRIRSEYHLSKLDDSLEMQAHYIIKTRLAAGR